MELTPEGFERRLEMLGLSAERVALKTKPAAIHWHIRKPGQVGTLEATWVDGKWDLVVRSNRRGEWTSQAMDELSDLSEES